MKKGRGPRRGKKKAKHALPVETAPSTRKVEKKETYEKKTEYQAGGGYGGKGFCHQKGISKVEECLKRTRGNNRSREKKKRGGVGEVWSVHIWDQGGIAEGSHKSEWYR